MRTRLPAIEEAARQIRDRRCTPGELLETCLRNIASFDAALRAWVEVDGNAARRDADRLTRLAGEGTWLGPLHGIPLGIKDIVDVAGFPTRAGAAWRDNRAAVEDAPLVARLRRAGAIVIGKTVTTQFACFDPPVTRNPWNVNHTPGGSSSGSAAAVAAEMCFAAIGSQTGGSIIRPAAYCGVAGLKATHGRVSSIGVVPVSPRLDHVGPLARTAGDLSVLYQALCPSLANADQNNSPDDDPRYGVNDHFRGGSLVELASGPTGVRLFLLEEFFLERSEPNVTAVVREAIERLRATVDIQVRSLPPGFESVHLMHRRLMAYEAARYHERAFRAGREHFAPLLAELLDEGLALTRRQFLEAAVAQQAFQRQLAHAYFHQGDILLMPATSNVAPDRSTTGDPAFQSPWSYAGVPAVTVPCGLDSQSGLPVGMQLVAPAGCEPRLLAAAAAIERHLGWSHCPPLWENDGRSPSEPRGETPSGRADENPGTREA